MTTRNLENITIHQFLRFRDLHEIIAPKNVTAGLARRHVFGFYMDHFFGSLSALQT